MFVLLESKRAARFSGHPLAFKLTSNLLQNDSYTLGANLRYIRLGGKRVHASCPCDRVVRRIRNGYSIVGEDSHIRAFIGIAIQNHFLDFFTCRRDNNEDRVLIDSNVILLWSGGITCLFILIVAELYPILCVLVAFAISPIRTGSPGIVISNHQSHL